MAIVKYAALVSLLNFPDWLQLRRKIAETYPQLVLDDHVYAKGPERWVEVQDVQVVVVHQAHGTVLLRDVGQLLRSVGDRRPVVGTRPAEDIDTGI